MIVKNKTIIVTGGGNGLGRELVLNLLSKGARVIAVDINRSALEETQILACNLGGSLNLATADITNRATVEALVEDLITKYQSLDGVINNAGIIQPFVKLNDLGYNSIEMVMNVNFYGPIYLIKALLPHFLKREEAHIVNISSMGGFLPVPGQSIYGASKAAIKLLSESLKSEMSGTNVKVTVVFPGAMRTDIMKNSGLNTPTHSDNDPQSAKITSARDAAKMIIEAMEKNKFRLLVGKDARVMDLLYRISPIRAANMIYKKMKDKIS